MKNIIRLKINGVDVIGYTDKDVDFDVIAFATLEIKNPVALTYTKRGISISPYFQFATSAVATFNTDCIAAFVPQGQLPKDVKDLYRKFSAASSRKKGTGR
jgi:hypothetical protein